jgi:nucleoside-diphosphate-sugar epimerase
MKIAITGSTGFIGGRLASAFASAGAEVTAFGRKPDIRFPEENITYVRWDMRERICSVSKDREIDVFVHSAANTNWKDPVSTLVADNEKTVSNVLEAASRAKHVILVSTSSVYQGIH